MKTQLRHVTQKQSSAPHSFISRLRCLRVLVKTELLQIWMWILEPSLCIQCECNYLLEIIYFIITIGVAVDVCALMYALAHTYTRV